MFIYYFDIIAVYIVLILVNSTLLNTVNTCDFVKDLKVKSNSKNNYFILFVSIILRLLLIYIYIYKYIYIYIYI